MKGRWYWVLDLEGNKFKEFLTPAGVAAAVRLGYSLERIEDVHAH